MKSAIIVKRFVKDALRTTEKVAHVDGSCQEHTSGGPTMQPVYALMTDAGEESNDVVFPGE